MPDSIENPNTDHVINGDLVIKNKKKERIRLDKDNGEIIVKDKNGKIIFRGESHKGNIRLGGNNTKQDGDCLLYPQHATSHADNQASIWLDASRGSIFGGGGIDGKLDVRTKKGISSIALDAEKGHVFLNNNGKKTIHLDGRPGDVVTFNNGKKTIHLDGRSGNIKVTGNIEVEGDIIIKNADCAENFTIDDNEKIEPGDVMTITSEDKLTLSTKAYDKCVAGIISGAGGYKPGIILDKQKSSHKRVPLALMGKAYCKADASYSSIKVGDLLTTSDTIGHVMKASDPSKSIGAIVGKSLKPLSSGTGLIPILVALQ